MAVTTPSYYSAPELTDEEKRKLAAEQEGQNTVPGKDSPNPVIYDQTGNASAPTKTNTVGTEPVGVKTNVSNGPWDPTQGLSDLTGGNTGITGGVDLGGGLTTSGQSPNGVPPGWDPTEWNKLSDEQKRQSGIAGAYSANPSNTTLPNQPKYGDIPGFVTDKIASGGNAAYTPGGKYSPAVQNFSQFLGSGGQIGQNNLGAAVDFARKNGFPNAQSLGSDKIDYGDGNGPIDVVKSDGSVWFQNGPDRLAPGQSAPGQSAPGQSAPPESIGPQYTPLPAGGGTKAPPGAFNPPPPAPTPMTTPTGGIPPGVPYQPYVPQPATPYTPTPTTPGAAYNPTAPNPNSVYNPDLNRASFNQNAPTYNPTNISQYSAPNQSAGQARLDQAAGGLNQTFSQFQAPTEGNLPNLQNQGLTNILSNPLYGDAYKNQLNEQQKELILGRSQADQRNSLQNAASRGTAYGGAQEAAQRRIGNEATHNLLQSQRDVDLSTTQANRDALLNALTSSQGIISSRLQGANQNFASTLAGQQAAGQYGLNTTQVLNDLLNSQTGRSTQQFASQLAGQQAQAGENQAGYASQADALKANQAKDAMLEQLRQSGAASNLSADQLKAQQGQFGATLGENQRQFNTGTAVNENQFGASRADQNKQFLDSLAAAQNQTANQFNESQRQFGVNAGMQQQGINLQQQGINNQAGQFNQTLGENARQFNASNQLSRDQFNQSTKQFSQSFLEQIRQFDANLAAQMEQFNKSQDLQYNMANNDNYKWWADRSAGGGGA